MDLLPDFERAAVLPSVGDLGLKQYLTGWALALHATYLGSVLGTLGDGHRELPKGMDQM